MFGTKKNPLRGFPRGSTDESFNHPRSTPTYTHSMLIPLIFSIIVSVAPRTGEGGEATTSGAHSERKADFGCRGFSEFNFHGSSLQG